MTLTLKNNDALALIPGRKTRNRFVAMLLLSMGLLVGGLRAAAQTTANYVWTVESVKDNQVYSTGSDIARIVATPINIVPSPPPFNGPVTIKIKDGSGGSVSVVVNLVNGVALVPFSNDQPGTVTFEVDQYLAPLGTPALASRVFTFKAAPGPPDPALSYVIVNQSTSPADGTSTDVVSAYLFDADGNACTSGQLVTFSLPNGTPVTITTNTATPGVASSIVNKATASFTSTTPGTYFVTVTYNGSVINDGQTHTSPSQIQFTVLPPSTSTSYIIGITTSTAADNSSQDEVDAIVKNQIGGNVPDGTPVTFTILSGAATITTTGIVTGGVAKAFFKSAVVGTVQVQAQVDINGTPTYLNDFNAPANNYTPVQFTLPPPNAATSYIVGIVTSTAADNSSTDEVDAVVNNALGPVPDGTAVTFTIQSGTATFTTTGITQGGVAKAYFKSSVVGSVQVQAQVDINGVPTYLTDQNAPANDYTTVQFTTPPPTLATSHIVGIVTSTAADNSSTDEVDAIVNNVNGPVPDGTIVTFTIKSGTATITTTGVTQGGVAKAYFKSSVIGSVQVQAQIDINGTPTYLTDLNATTNDYTTIQFVAGPPVGGGNGGGGNGGGNGGGGNGGGNGGGGGGNGGGSGGGTGTGSNNGITNLFIRQPYDYQLADGVKQDSLIAYVTDAGGNPLTGIKVTFIWHTTPEQGTIANGAKFVGDSVDQLTVGGFARIAVTSIDTGTLFVEAYFTDPATNQPVSIWVADNGPINNYETIHFVTAPDVTNPLTALFTIIPEALADGQQQTEVKAHIVDLNGYAMPDQPVTFAVDSGSGTIVTPQPVYTDANGDAYIFITSKTPGDVLITATVDDKKIIFGSPARVRFAPINIYVPRVFTPNNDGTNDILRPILVGIAQFHYFSIYNRWGNLIFTTQDAGQGWDGTFRGVPQPVETYLWIAEGIDTNGKKIVQRGMVSLVR
ncbi:MAG TPA: Ig-like domain-containing protein [Puia sp.]|uniref:Ig-like domain-containing protein n=1 Tax=Puia sp. TaxID=2045100 RepID=UPI002CD2DC35|nr:Ig-like domain-containing protein [Puia sp.]HVU98122.1 Ig-like domain-containing protein [Puia sp.]